MTNTKSNIAAIAAAVLLTLVTFQQAIVAPASPAPVASVNLA